MFPSNFEDVTRTLDDELTKTVSQFDDLYEICICLQENICEENIAWHTLNGSEQISTSTFVNQTADEELTQDQISSHESPSFITYQSITLKEGTVTMNDFMHDFPLTEELLQYVYNHCTYHDPIED